MKTGLQQLIDANVPILDDIKEMTPGDDLRRWLNDRHGPGTPHFDAVVSLARQGLAEGWVAADEVMGPHYRRQLLAPPSDATHYFSISSVYIDSGAGRPGPYGPVGPKKIFAGHYHGHPYGEINIAIPIDKNAELAGTGDWQGLGWVCAEPNTRHYPEVRNGALLTLFYLPAGRIAYNFEASEMPVWRNGAS